MGITVCLNARMVKVDSLSGALKATRAYMGRYTGLGACVACYVEIFGKSSKLHVPTTEKYQRRLGIQS